MRPKVRQSSSVDVRTRLRYAFDNLLARGTWAVLLWLGVITLGAVAVSSTLLAAFRVEFAGSEEQTWLEDFWQSLLRVVDPGTMAADVGWGARVLAFTITIFGILVAGTLIGLIANGVEQRVEAMRRGRSTVVESNHVVVLGASRRLAHVVAQLALANRGHRSSAIVVLANREPVQLREETLAAAGDLHGSRLVVRRGEPRSVADLGLVRLPHARAVIVLADDDASSDGDVVTAVLSVAATLGAFDRVPIVAELSDPAVVDSLQRASGGAVHTAVALQSAARIVAFALGEPGLDEVVMALLDHRTCSIYVEPAGDLVGASFGECVIRFSDARPIGLGGPDGAVVVNPDPATHVGPHDRLIVIADAEGPVPLPTGFADVPPSVAWPPRWAAAGREEHVVIQGWSDLGPHIVASLDEIVAAGSSVDVVYDPALIEREQIQIPPLDTLTVSLRPGPGAAWSLDGLDGAKVTTIVLLAQGAGVTPADTDSRTLLTHMALHRELDGSRGPRPNVVVELLDAGNRDLVQMTSADDYVVSDAITSRLLTQLAEQPERRSIFLQIYAAGGPSMRLIHARDLGLVGDVGCADVITTAYAAGLLAVGWRTGAALRLNPPTSERVRLDDDDHIVVIG